MLVTTVIPVRAAPRKAHEEIRAPRNSRPIRLRCGINLIPGTVRVTTRDGRTVLQTAEEPAGPGVVGVSPVGVLRFSRKDGDKRYRVVYMYEARRIAILPPDNRGAPEEIAREVRHLAEQSFAEHGYDVLPEAQVDRTLQEDHIYASGQMTPDVIRRVGARTGAEQLLVLHLTDWKKRGGVSFSRFLWSGPFGPRKQLELGATAEVYDVADARRMWESRATGETTGGRFGGTTVRLKRAVAQDAVSDLLDSFLEP